MPYRIAPRQDRDEDDGRFEVGNWSCRSVIAVYGMGALVCTRMPETLPISQKPAAARHMYRAHVHEATLRANGSCCRTCRKHAGISLWGPRVSQCACVRFMVRMIVTGARRRCMTSTQ